MTTTVPKGVWRDSYEQGHQNGEGITRCSDPEADYFWVNVYMRGAPPMASRVRAYSARQAVEFCQNRHPNAVLVQLVEEDS
jgi:hypothetical protein